MTILYDQYCQYYKINTVKTIVDYFVPILMYFVWSDLVQVLPSVTDVSKMCSSLIWELKDRLGLSMPSFCGQ